MSDSTPRRPGADRNLLFGILALQMDFIRREALIAAMNAWVLDKTRPLGQILVEQGALPPGKRALLEPLVEAHLEMHGGDVEKSLAAVGMPTPLRDELQSLADGDLDASLALLPGELPSTVAEAPDGARGLRYQILRPHARGGLGEVFVALDQELHREVALKEIDAKQADDPHSRGRFVREAEITGGLEHPGVVPVYGLGRHADGRPFYAMRFIRGETLKDAIARLHSAPRRALAQGEQEFRQLLGRFVAVCNAVAYAHSRGVIHRDLKPSNVMLGPYGETLVVDWGLAKAIGRDAVEDDVGWAEPTLVPVLAEGSSATRTGAALGTPAYMSPEQAAGRLDQLGPASDVYSLGATLYALLTGRPPVEGKDAGEILGRAQRGDWPRPRQVNPAVPRALDAVCRKALAREPGSRYATALDLAADVERWLADEPVSAWREPWVVRGRRWLGKHRTLVASAVATVLVAVVALTVGLVLLAAAAEGEARARKKAEENESELRRTLYLAHMNLVQREYEANNIAHVRELLEAYTSWPQGAEDLRGFEWYYWHRLAHRELRALQGHTGTIYDVAFSPDGRRIASAGHDGTVRLWDPDSGQETLSLKGHTGEVWCVAFSPDGRRIASSGDDGTVKLWDAGSGQKILSLKGHTLPVYRVAFSPDGRRVATASNDSTVKVWDTGSGQQTLSLRGHTNRVVDVTFSPDGRRIASASVDGTAKVWDAGSGEETLTFTGHKSQVFSVAFSPDGRRIASAGADLTVRVWAADSGQERLTLRGHTNWVYCVAFSPDGRRIASGSIDRTVRVWDAGSGQETMSLKGHTSDIRTLAIGPDGRRIASGSLDSLLVWATGSGQETLTLKGHRYGVRSVAFNPDGRRIASASYDGTLKLWDGASGQEFFTLKGHTDQLMSVAFSSDGRRMASAGVDRTVKLWDSGSGAETLTLIGHTAGVWCVAFSPDGRHIASGSDDSTAKVWDADSGQEALTLKGHTSAVTSVAFSPDGRRIASASQDHTLKVWDAATGLETTTLKGHRDRVWCLAFSPDGRRIASASSDHTVKVWDATSGLETLTLKGHSNWVSGVTFSPDGRRLASACTDGTVKVWDAASGQETLTLKGHTNWAFSVAFSPDGSRLASASADGTVRLWETQLLSAEELEHREIVVLVRDLFDRLLLRSEVLAHVRKDPMLDAATRDAALQVAQTVSEDPERLNNAAWEVVKAPRANPDAYALAIRQAEAAVQAAPGEGHIVNTLGVGLYRVRDYAKALETLEKSEVLESTKDGSHPTDLAFLAMTHHQLGHKEQAHATLARLREVAKQQPWAKDDESHGFLREAEELIDSKPLDKKP